MIRAIKTMIIDSKIKLVILFLLILQWKPDGKLGSIQDNSNLCVDAIYFKTVHARYCRNSLLTPVAWDICF